MLFQIPYSLNELTATGEFLWRRRKVGRPLLHILLRRDTDDGPPRFEADDFERPFRKVARDVWMP